MGLEPRSHCSHERRPFVRERDRVARTDDLDVALAPVTVGTADNELSATRVKAELQERDRSLRVGCEPRRDHVGAIETVELPFNLLAKPRLVDRLPPGRVPLVAARVQ